MNGNALKRQRSDESIFSLQSKIFVNEKLANSCDANKMKQIYEKTTKMLFQAQQNQITASDNNNNNNKYNKPATEELLPLWKLVFLRGNGDVDSLPYPEGIDEDDPANEFLWVKKHSKCCDRKTYVQSHCGNQCFKNLCEFCGYSCVECGIFLCNSCVDVFGSGNSEHPICERCSLFN